MAHPMKEVSRLSGRAPRALLPVIALLAAAGIASGAQAQEQPPPVADTPGLSRTGLEPTMAVTDDSNVPRSTAAVALQRGLTPHDDILQPNLTMDILKAIGRESVFARGMLGYDGYLRNTLLDNARMDMDVGVDKFLGSCRATLSGQYARGQSELQDLTDPTERRLAQNILTTSGGTFDAGCLRPIGVTPTFTVSESATTNSATVRQTADYNSLSMKGGLTYQRPIFGQLALYAQYRKTDYVHELVSVRGLSVIEGYKLTATGLQFSRDIGARIQTSIDVSYSSLRPDIPTEADFNGVTYQVNLTVSPSSRISTKFDFERGTNPSNRINAAFSIDQTVKGEIDYALGSSVKLSTGGQSTESRYEGAELSPILDLTQERTISYFGKIEFDIGQKLALFANAQYEIRNANISALSYVDTKFVLTAQGHF